jgi:hypothetical protein
VLCRITAILSLVYISGSYLLQTKIQFHQAVIIFPSIVVAVNLPQKNRNSRRLRISNQPNTRREMLHVFGKNIQRYRQRQGTLTICIRRWKFIIRCLWKKNPWPESASELYLPSDRRLSVKLVPTFEDRVCHLVSVTDPYGRILGFLDRCWCFFFQVAPQLYSRGWVDPVPDPLLLRKCGSAGNRTRASVFVVRNCGH